MMIFVALFVQITVTGYKSDRYMQYFSSSFGKKVQ